MGSDEDHTIWVQIIVSRWSLKWPPADAKNASLALGAQGQESGPKRAEGAGIGRLQLLPPLILTPKPGFTAPSNYWVEGRRHVNKMAPADVQSQQVALVRSGPRGEYQYYVAAKYL